jgi:hypothetical protein
MTVFPSWRRTPHSIAATVAALACLAAFHAVAASAAPSVTPPYQLSVFAQSANGYSQPDSIVQFGDSIIVGFQNHVAKDGSDGKSSTIVQFALNGRVQRTFSVPGHNDGLRVIGANELWALQNEDANPNLVVIDLNTGRQTLYTFPASTTPHGGGFDDIVELHGDVYFTASNPGTDSNGVNIFPALVRARLHSRHSNTVDVEPVMFGNSHAVDIPTGATVQLNLSDPDSMTVDPRGNIVFTSQADGLLIFVRDPLTSNQVVGRLPITAGGSATTLDDTAFVPSGAAYMLFSDVAGDTIYRLDSGSFGFSPGIPYSGSDTTGVLGVLSLDTGVVTPIGTGFKSVRGIVFVTPAD